MISSQCNLCGTSEFLLLKSKLRDDAIAYKVYECRHCGHIQLLPKPDEQDDRGFYDKNQQDKNRNKVIDYQILQKNNLFDSERHVKLIQDLAAGKDVSLLDIGSGYGFFLNALDREGYRNLTGVEISSERRTLAQKHSRVKFIEYDVMRPDSELGPYDIVTFFHVLEHMGDPIAFLKSIRNLVRKGGTLICEVPNVRELLLDHCAAYNDFYWIRAHLNYFSDKTLSECFKKAGYSNIELRFEQRYGLNNLCNWLSQGKPQIENPVFRITEAYAPVELRYREWLESQGRSDALIAIVRNA